MSIHGSANCDKTVQVANVVASYKEPMVGAHQGAY